MTVMGKELQLLDIGIWKTDAYGNYTRGDCEAWRQDPNNAGYVMAVKVVNCFRTPMYVYVPGRVDQYILYQKLRSLERKYSVEYYKAGVD